MSKVLYIGNSIEKIAGGADTVNKRNLGFLFRIFGKENVVLFPLATNNTTLEKIMGYLAGLNLRKESEILKRIKVGGYSHVFIPHSVLGRLAKKIKQRFDNQIQILTFFHNIEKQYAEEFIKTQGRIKLPFLWSVSYNEKLAVRYSDQLIVLNERDSGLLNSYYHKEATAVLPASYEDVFSRNSIEFNNDKPAYLFVGTAFFANTSGIEWFIKEVLPNVPGVLTVVGNGMDLHFSNLTNSRVKVLGFVEDLGKFYYEKSIVIAPIFSGGGMKTKTAEALMYGKTIVGTKEAFEGYPKDPLSMVECNTKEEFITKLNSLSDFGFNQASREIFVKNYSNEVLFQSFSKLFKSISK